MLNITFQIIKFVLSRCNTSTILHPFCFLPSFSLAYTSPLPSPPPATHCSCVFIESRQFMCVAKFWNSGKLEIYTANKESKKKPSETPYDWNRRILPETSSQFFTHTNTTDKTFYVRHLTSINSHR